MDELLKHKCSRKNFLFVEQCSGWTQENEDLDYLLFYKDSLHLLEKGKTKLAKSILAPIIIPVYGNTVNNFVYDDAVHFLSKDFDFHPLKHSSSVMFLRAIISLQLFIKLQFINR